MLKVVLLSGSCTYVNKWMYTITAVSYKMVLKRFQPPVKSFNGNGSQSWFKGPKPMVLIFKEQEAQYTIQCSKYGLQFFDHSKHSQLKGPKNHPEALHISMYFNEFLLPLPTLTVVSYFTNTLSRLQ
jgi:hypothetical protein